MTQTFEEILNKNIENLKRVMNKIRAVQAKRLSGKGLDRKNYEYLLNQEQRYLHRIKILQGEKTK